jgi:SH3-like domain-containing protein
MRKIFTTAQHMKNTHNSLFAKLVIALAAAFVFCPAYAASKPAAQNNNTAGNASSVPAAGSSGLPIPRFVSLGTNKVYVRTGPGKQYPIDWIYQRKNLPVEVTAEYDIWRRVRDHEGSSGWVHGSMLSGRRTVTIQNGIQTLYYKPDLQSRPVMRAEADVIAELRRCQPGWCEIQIDGKRGWIKISGIWGSEKSDIRK